MTYRCPKCSRAIGDVAPAGTQELLCSRCQVRYQLLTGRLDGRASRQITLQRKTSKHSGSYARSYELRIVPAGGALEVLDFQVDGKEDWVRIRRGDTITVVHSLRGGAREDLVEILDHTTGQAYGLNRPGQKAQSALVAVTLVVVVASFVATCAVSSSNLGIATAVSLLLGVVTAIVMAKTTTLEEDVPSDDLARLQAAQGLLAKRETLTTTLESARVAKASKQDAVAKVTALIEKMEGVGEELYATRLERLRAGRDMLRDQLAIDTQLVQGYEKAILMVQIEIDAHGAAGLIPDEALQQIDTKLGELSALKEMHADLQRRLSAYEEVERALGS